MLGMATGGTGADFHGGGPRGDVGSVGESWRTGVPSSVGGEGASSGSSTNGGPSCCESMCANCGGCDAGLIGDRCGDAPSDGGCGDASSGGGVVDDGGSALPSISVSPSPSIAPVLHAPPAGGAIIPPPGASALQQPVRRRSDCSFLQGARHCISAPPDPDISPPLAGAQAYGGLHDDDHGCTCGAATSNALS